MTSGDKRFSEWGCSKCRGKKWKEHDWKRATRNCDGKHPLEGAALQFDWNPTLQRCPFSVVKQETWGLVELWRTYKEFDALPYPGNALEQPAPITRVLIVCERNDLTPRGEGDK